MAIQQNLKVSESLASKRSLRQLRWCKRACPPKGDKRGLGEKGEAAFRLGLIKITVKESRFASKWAHWKELPHEMQRREDRVAVITGDTAAVQEASWGGGEHARTARTARRGQGRARFVAGFVAGLEKRREAISGVLERVFDRSGLPDTAGA